MNQRIAEVRKSKGVSQAALAAMLGIHPTSMNRIEKGGTDVSTSRLAEIAEALGVSPADLVRANRARLIGYIGAGGEVYATDDGDCDEIDAPPGAPDGYEAFVVRNGSMWPAYIEGQIIYVSPAVQDIESLIGVECAVELADGRRLLKTISPSPRPGRWRLDSHNAPPIDDAKIVRAAPVEWVSKRPRR